MGRYCSPVGSEPIEMRPAGEGRDTGDGALFGSIRRVVPVKLTVLRRPPAAGVGEIVSSEIFTNFGDCPVGMSCQ